MTVKHPKTTPAPLREQIARHLDAHPESPVKAIAKACGQADYPSRIVAQLNVMRTDGDVECEQRKGEMRYWLARPLEVIVGAQKAVASVKVPASDTLPPGIRPGTRAAQIWLALGGEAMHASDIATTLGVANGAVAPVLTTMARDGFLTRTVDGNGLYLHSRPTVATQPQPEVGENTGSEGSAVPVPDVSTEAAAVPEPAPAPAPTPLSEPVAEDEQASMYREICERYGINDCPAGLAGYLSRTQESHSKLAADIAAWRAVAEPFECYTPSAFMEFLADLSARARTGAKDADEIASVHDMLAAQLAPETDPRDPSDMATEDLARIVLEQLNSDRRNAVALADKLQHLLDSARHECEGLRAEVARLSESVVGTLETTEAVDVLDAATAYMIRIPKRRPRIITKPENARDAALAAVRNSAPRAEVFALVSVGTARRGVEWKDA